MNEAQFLTWIFYSALIPLSLIFSFTPTLGKKMRENRFFVFVFAISIFVNLYIDILVMSSSTSYRWSYQQYDLHNMAFWNQHLPFVVLLCWVAHSVLTLSRQSESGQNYQSWACYAAPVMYFFGVFAMFSSMF